MELLPKVPPDVAERKGSPKPPGYPEDPFVRPRPGPALPELRFEHGYLLSIRPFIKPVEVSGELAVGQKEVIYGVPVSIQWRQVAWVTVRDQVIMPLVQGAIWGIASIFLVPLARGAGTWLSGTSHNSTPSTRPNKGQPGEVGWLRTWMRTWLGSPNIRQ